MDNQGPIRAWDAPMRPVTLRVVWSTWERKPLWTVTRTEEGKWLSSTGRSTHATASLHIQAPLSQAGPRYTALDEGRGAPGRPRSPRCEPGAAASPGDPGGVNETMEVKAQHHAGVPHRAEHTRWQSKGKGCQLATIGKCLR